MDAQQVTEGLTVLQGVATVIGSLGAFRGIEWLIEQRNKRRAALATERAAAAEIEHGRQEQDQKHARSMRRDAMEDQAALIDRQERRIGALEARVDSLNHEHLNCEKRAAGLEARLEASEQERKELRADLDALTKTVNGGTK